MGEGRSEPSTILQRFSLGASYGCAEQGLWIPSPHDNAFSGAEIAKKDLWAFEHLVVERDVIR